MNLAQTKGQKAATAKKTSSGSRRQTASSGRKQTASGSKKSSAGSGNRSSASGSRSRTAAAKAEASELRLRGDILVLLAFALSVLLFIGNLGFGGVLGKALSTVAFGLFGLMAYVLPFLFFYCFLFILANGSGYAAGLRIGGLWGLYVFICAFFQLVLYGFEREYSFTDYYSQSALDHSGGGFCGGFLVKVFGTAFGTIGAYVVILIGLVIFTIMLTQKPLLSALRVHSGEAYGAALEQREERLALIEERREARKAELEERALQREEEALLREERRLQKEEERRLQKEELKRLQKEHEAERRQGRTGQTAAATVQTRTVTEPRPLQIVTLSDASDASGAAGSVYDDTMTAGGSASDALSAGIIPDGNMDSSDAFSGAGDPAESRKTASAASKKKTGRKSC